MNEDIMVSVCCTAYNHEKYIRRCLDGFVMQKTDFKYEVIINDDASKDNTANIIREYEEKYPDIIRPIYQTENQYSIDKNIVFNILYPKVRGKYIALCEGDDFWTDPLKLQKQVDALETNPDCHMCVAKVISVSEDGKEKIGQYPSVKIDQGPIKSEQLLKMICTQYTFQTSSFVFRNDDAQEYAHHMPEFRRISPVGDICYLLYFAHLGSVYYIDEEMSCYRMGSVSSWTQSLMEDREKVKQHNQKMMDVLREYDKFTEGKYHKICNAGIWSRLNLNADSKQEFKALINYEDELFRTQPLRRKVRIYLGAYCPPLLKLYYKIIG